MSSYRRPIRITREISRENFNGSDEDYQRYSGLKARYRDMSRHDLIIRLMNIEYYDARLRESEHNNWSRLHVAQLEKLSLSSGDIIVAHHVGMFYEWM